MQVREEGKNWFVIQTKPRQEHRALFFLGNKGVEVYLPKMEVMSFHAGRGCTVRRPLFPGYLFARFEADSDTDTVRWTQGVMRVLLHSSRPVPLGDDVVQNIRSMEERDGLIRRRELQRYNRVRITRGPFKDVLGIFDCWLSDRDRVKILIDLVSYQAAMELHPSLIERVA